MPQTITKAALGELRIDLSNPDELRDYLVASLSESGADLKRWSGYFRRACGWYANLIAQGFDRLPFFLVFDLGLLLLKGRSFPFRSLSEQRRLQAEERGGQDASRRRHVGYENRLLNRFLALSSFRELQTILEDGLDVDARVSAMLECWVAPLREVELPSLQIAAHAIRRLAKPGQSGPDTLLERVEGRLDHPGLFAAQCEVLIERYDTLSLQRLIGPEDIFVFRHIEALGRRAQRLVARQISEIEVGLGEPEPPPAHLRQEAPQVSVDLDDAGYFPQGGLDQLANRGSIENLVRTELGYIEDGEQIDLFTLRYLEGELLYYTRDEGQLMRRSRTVHVCLKLSSAHHILYPGHPMRLAILLQALINRLVDDLFELFETDALQIVLRVGGVQSAEVSELCEIRFQEAIERGELRVVRSEGEEALPHDDTLPERLLEKGRLTTYIAIGDDLQIDEATRGAWLREGLEAFAVECPSVRVASEETEDADARDQPWRFGVRLDEAEILGHLQSIRRGLVWRLFGC